MSITKALKDLPLVVRLLLFVDLFLCLAYLSFQLYDTRLEKFTVLFDLDSEISIATWYSSIQYFLSFLLASVFTYYRLKKDPKKLILIFLPLLFLAMSIDEIVEFHEWVGWQIDFYSEEFSRKNSIFSTTGIWALALGIPFAIIFGLFTLYLAPLFNAYKRSLLILIIGMVILLTGAVGFELNSNFVSDQALILNIFFEEGLELLGSTVLFWAVYNVSLADLPQVVANITSGKD